jgi:hypothetical protein
LGTSRGRGRWVKLGEELETLGNRFVLTLELLEVQSFQQRLWRVIEVHDLRILRFGCQDFTQLFWKQRWVAEKPRLDLVDREKQTKLLVVHRFFEMLLRPGDALGRCRGMGGIKRWSVKIQQSDQSDHLAAMHGII